MFGKTEDPLKCPIFSILVASIPPRHSTTCAALLANLYEQIKTCPPICPETHHAIHAQQAVEVLVFHDNYHRPVGAKRNALLALAQGEWCAFIDDDDEVAPDYVSTILRHLIENPTTDVVCFQQVATINGGPEKLCFFSSQFTYVDGPARWCGKPSHVLPWRTSIAKKHLFPETDFGEDTAWVLKAVEDVKVETKIDRVLHYYRFSSATSATRGTKAL